MKKIDLAFLRNIPLFTDLSDDRLEKIRRIITEKNVTAGTVIIKEGTKGT